MYVVFPAEWSLQSAVQFTFPHKNTDWVSDFEKAAYCFAECITLVSQFQKVLVVCHDISETKKYLLKATQENIILIEVPSNDTWARDHGPITVFKDGKPCLLDFTFNGWGQKFSAEKDNLITQKLFYKGIFSVDLFEQLDFVLEGGAIETDGQGTLLTTASCLLSENRNPGLSKRVIEEKLKNWLGLKRILWLNHGYLVGDDTDGHIDTLARFCTTESIAYVKCDKPGDPHFEPLQKMEAELRGFSTLDGKPYNLVPLPWPDPCFDNNGHRLPATYANFLIINQAVLVPTYNLPQDELALQVLQNCFPKRKIIGVNCRPLIEQHGSLHCISMQYPKGVF